jgi:phage tail-like protein
VSSLLNINKAVEAIFGPLDPALEFHFYVLIDDMVEGAFAECSGMKADREVITVKEGGLNHRVHKLGGRTTYGEITLRKGIMFSIEFWDWYEEGKKDGKVEKRDFTIVHHSSYLNVPSRWYHIENAFPISWEAAALRADSSQVAMESLTLTFEKLSVEDWSIMGLMAKLVPS